MPEVVFATIDEQMMEEEGGEMPDVKDVDVSPPKSDDGIARENKEKEAMPKRQTSVSDIIKGMEKLKEEQETEVVRDRSASPRSGSTSPRSPRSSSHSGAQSPKEGSVSPRARREQAILETDETQASGEPKVSVTSVVKKSDSFNSTSTKGSSSGVEAESVSVKIEKEGGKAKREVEIQSVKVKIDDDDEPIASSNIDDVITINGQPVPIANTIVLNGHITKIKDLPKGADGDSRATRRSESPRTVDNDIKSNRKSQTPSDSSRGSSQAREFVPQTDLDTFETKMTNNVEPLDISNPDDDSSDQRSDTGSINTMDSLDREEKESPRQRPKPAHIKPRSERVGALALCSLVAATECIHSDILIFCL